MSDNELCAVIHHPQGVSPSLPAAKDPIFRKKPLQTGVRFCIIVSGVASPSNGLIGPAGGFERRGPIPTRRPPSASAWFGDGLRAGGFAGHPRRLSGVLQKFGAAWRQCRFIFPAAPISSLKGWQIVAVGKSATGGRRPRYRTRKKSLDPEGVEQPSRRLCDPGKVELVSPRHVLGRHGGATLAHATRPLSSPLFKGGKRGLRRITKTGFGPVARASISSAGLGPHYVPLLVSKVSKERSVNPAGEEN